MYPIDTLEIQNETGLLHRIIGADAYQRDIAQI
jgi:hypothetical protein